jgi:4-amino-4-deoxy-L-arabinose transferase-like glycosyltransferase
VLVVVGIAFPRGWYDTLPWDARLPTPPFRGVTLLQLVFILEGLLVMAAGWFGLRAAWGTPAGRTAGRDGDGEPDVSARAALVALAIITALGLGLRLVRLDADLWLDEITPITRYRGFSTLELVTTYLSSNNHLLNTLLVRLVTVIFGEREWVVRLPAMLFGVAAVPALYWVARLVMSRVASLGAALLLAVSYHHIFFSQNARGYSAYLCLSLVATGCLIRGVERDRPGAWAGYITAMVANLATLLHAAFILAGHVLVGAGLVWDRRRRGEPAAPLARRLAVVFGVVGLLAFHIYATMLPQAYVVITNIYGRGTSGFSATSWAFVADLLTGLAEGFGVPWWLLAAAAAVGGYGFLRLLRLRWALGAALALPLLLTLAVLIVRHLSASPRFFLIGLPLAILAVVLGVAGVVRALLGRRWGGLATRRGLVAAVALLAVASVAALPAYYRMPKQAYRAALAYVRAERAPDDVIVLVHTAEQGFRFYAGRAGLREGRDFVVVRTVGALDTAVATFGARHLRPVTTFRRALRLGEPALYARLEAGWIPGRRFPGTVHDGTIAVWEPRAP